MSLSIPPWRALAADEALLEQPGEHWYTVNRPAVVLGLALHRRAAEVLDLDRCRAAGVEVLTRQAGGGAVLLDEGMLCYAVALPLPHPLAPEDLTQSYRWLGEHFKRRLQGLGVAHARRVEIAEARADRAALQRRANAARPARARRADAVAAALLASCFGAFSPHEVLVGSAKLVGLAQVRRRHAALFQLGVLLRDQAPLADLLRLPDEPTRAAVRQTLARRSIGLGSLLPRLPDLRELAVALSPDPAAF